MDKMELIDRAVQDHSWAAFMFIISFVLVAVLKSVFTKQFSDFIALLQNNKYIKLYNDGSFSLSWFSLVLVFIQLVSFSFFFQIILSNLDYIDKSDFGSYTRIFFFLTLFILTKFLIERGIAYLFNVESFYKSFLLHQMSYRVYLGLVMLLVSFLMFYSQTPITSVTYTLLGVFIIINLVIYLISFRIFQKEIIGNLFYFILYLCTLEIAPYYFAYYWFTKH